MAESPIEIELARHARRIGPILQELVPRDGDESAFLGGPAWYHLETGGKRIRSALCLLTTEALGGDSEKALHFAAAVELLHNMLLVHDDIEDGDTVRRNKPTVWKRVRAGERDQRRRLPVRALAARGDPFARAGRRAGAADGPVPGDLRADHRGPGARHQFPLRRALHHRGLPAHGHAEDRPLPRARHGRRSDHRRRAGGDARVPAPARREPRPGVPDPRRHPRPDRRQGARRRERLRHPRGQGEHPLRARAGALLAGRGRAPARGHAQAARGDDRRRRRRGPRPVRPVRLHRVRAGDGRPADPPGPARARRAARRAAVPLPRTAHLPSPKGKPE